MIYVTEFIIAYKETDVKEKFRYFFLLSNNLVQSKVK